jgi:hypothetical protein
MWELDKARQTVTPQDDMALYLCAERDRSADAPGRDAHRGHEVAAAPARHELTHGGHAPIRTPGDAGQREPSRPTRDPIRAGRDALLASLDRPLGDRPLSATGGTRSLEPTPAAAALGEPSRRRARPQSAYDDDREPAHEIPAVPSLAVLRPRRNGSAPAEGGLAEKPRKRAPSWDDVLFGSAPTARDA